MKSCPTHAVESSKIHNGFDTSGSRFQTCQQSLSHVFDRVQVWQQAWPWKTIDVLLIFVYLDDVIEYSEVLQCHLGAPCSGLLGSPRVTLHQVPGFRPGTFESLKSR